MMSKIKWFTIYLWISALHVHSMPTSATDFRDPAFGPYFELSTRQSLRHTTTIDYDQADFDEFGNDPGLYDVAALPDAIDPDVDQGFDYQGQGGADTGMAPPLFEPLYTNSPNAVTPIRGSGGISDEKRAKLGASKGHKTSDGLNDSTTNPVNVQNEAASDPNNGNISTNKQKSSTEDTKKGSVSTKSVDESNSTNTVENSTDGKQSTTGGSRPQTESATENNGETSGNSSKNGNDNKQGTKNIETTDDQNTKEGTESTSTNPSPEVNRNEHNDVTLPGSKTYDGSTFHSDESTSTEMSSESTSSESSSSESTSSESSSSESASSESTSHESTSHESTSSETISRESTSSESISRDNSAQTDSGSYEARHTTVSSESGNSGGSTSDSTSGESTERNSAEITSAEYSTYNHGYKSSTSVEAASSETMSEERMDHDSANTSKSKDSSDRVDKSSSTSTESGNSASDETGSSASNDSGSTSSEAVSVSDESGDDATTERTDSTSRESGGASSREKTDSKSVERSEDITRERVDSVSDERIDNDSDDNVSITKTSDQHYSDETGSDSHSQGSPEVSSNEGTYAKSSGSKSNIFTKGSDYDVSDEVPNTTGDQSSVSNIHSDSSAGSSSTMIHANNDQSSRGSDVSSASKSNKLVECFQQTVNDTDCFLLRSLYSICFNQFNSRCWKGVNSLRKARLSHFTSSSSGSSNFRSYDTSSESADVDDIFSDSAEASDSSSDASSKSLSFENIENLSASYEKASGIFEVIMLIKEACPSICALSESARYENNIGNGQGTLNSPHQDSSESSDEDDIVELSTNTYTEIRDYRANVHIASPQPPTYTRSSESNSIEVIIDKSSGSSNDDSQYSVDTSNDYSYENYSASDNTSE